MLKNDVDPSIFRTVVMSIFERMDREQTGELVVQQRFDTGEFVTLADGDPVDWSETASIVREMSEGKHAGTWIYRHPPSNLKMVMSIHSRTPGLPFGGIRFRSGESGDETWREALALSKVMTRKARIHQLEIGGGKIVVTGTGPEKTDEYLRGIGRILEQFGGFVAGPDMGFSPSEFSVIAEETAYIACAGAGDRPVFPHTGRVTAEGWMLALEETASWLAERSRWNDADLSDRSFAVQGVGRTGIEVIELLVDRGATVTVTDVDSERLSSVEENYEVTTVAPEDIYRQDCDVLVPAGPANVLNETTIPELNATVVAPVANCVLEDEEEDEKRLLGNGVFYQPESIANAGGVIQGIHEMKPENANREVSEVMGDVREHLRVIPENLRSVYEKARASDVGPLTAARRIVHNRLDDLR